MDPDCQAPLPHTSFTRCVSTKAGTHVYPAVCRWIDAGLGKSGLLTPLSREVELVGLPLRTPGANQDCHDLSLPEMLTSPRLPSRLSFFVPAAKGLGYEPSQEGPAPTISSAGRTEGFMQEDRLELMHHRAVLEALAYPRKWFGPQTRPSLLTLTLTPGSNVAPTSYPHTTPSPSAKPLSLQGERGCGNPSQGSVRKEMEREFHSHLRNRSPFGASGGAATPHREASERRWRGIWLERPRLDSCYRPDCRGRAGDSEWPEEKHSSTV
jgi:hypothetical protein